jgi:hypothetical protein
LVSENAATIYITDFRSRVNKTASVHSCLT